jgi:hypothetical protein
MFRGSAIGEIFLAWSDHLSWFGLLCFSKRVEYQPSDISFLYFRHLLFSHFTDAEGDRLLSISLCDACHERKLPFADATEDQCSVTAIFLSDFPSSFKSF